MDRMRSRKPTFKGHPSLVSRATHEDFKPTIEWIDDQSRRTLLLQLPGFKREEIRVQLDNAGKLLIKGSKQVSENKYLDVDEIFDVPEDTIADKISGRFEDGRLTLVMPKREVKEFVGEKKEAAKYEGHIEEKTPMHEEKKDEHIEERTKDTGESQNEPTQEEKAKSIGEDKKDAAAKHEHPEEKPTSREEKEENRKEEKPKDTKEKQNEPTRKETRKSKDEPVKEEESKNIEEKTTKMKKLREMRKMIPISWLDPGTLDKLNRNKKVIAALDKLNRNKKVIAVAVVSFSAGVYACLKLSSSGMSSACCTVA
ncbi:uncharacterized protein A4U43_C03F29700 [Asparagus officinalis]|uniref:SHSP domain-containing protein n=1 Tax=Asparagus officinalis TaxID=4686 RepID=A0A5P1FIW7_ASPOF|nr:inactive protein RESTRICTED TEV MOVEMENT 2-like [Asparagus officinalis]ONK76571.1 uncharacterized protein A4U43_C03F29700 [Asparagus officinalis]